MSETKHTPTPWYLADDDDCRICCPEEDVCTADTHRDEYSPDEDEAIANAAFIVRAVNSHDALVEALQSLLDETLNCVDDGTLPRDAVDNNAGVKKARTALAKARG